MALWSSSSSPKGIVVTFPVLLLTAFAAILFCFFFISNLSSCSCPVSPRIVVSGTAASNGAHIDDGVLTNKDDVDWVKDQIKANGLQMHENVLRKGINPRTRAQQLEDLKQFKGISHYEGSEGQNRTALPCPGELLVEEHHSNYGEPWAGGRDVFEFLAQFSHITPDAHVLEIGCGTLRVGLHFIRFLKRGHYHCLERDELSMMAAFRYELPSQGLLSKRPLIVKGEDMNFNKFGSEVLYDLIYASAVFLHMPDKLVWVGLERLANKLKPYDGRIFVSHNIKFCSRLGGEECTKRLTNLGLEYLGKRTHDSLLFNHYEIWFEFRRSKP